MFRRFFSESRNSKSYVRHRPRNADRFVFESLEDRRLLATFTVANNGDGPVAAAGDLVGSLRQAIFDANANPGEDIIAFDSFVFRGGDSSLIRLTDGELEITDSLTIDGGFGRDVTITGDADGDDVTLADNITDVSASFGGTVGATDDLLDDNSRVLDFSPLSGSLNLNGLTITGGRASGVSGGGVIASGDVTLTNSTVSGNSSTGVSSSRGGGVIASGDVTLTNSTVSGNSSTGVSSSRGGGVFASGDVTLTDSTVSGNSSTGVTSSRGGGVYASGDVRLTNSTVAGNSSTGVTSSRGGGVFASGDVTLTNSTVAGNSSTGVFAHGGGVYAVDGMTVNNSIIAGNSDAGNAPDLNAPMSLVVQSSIIGDTTGTTLTAGNSNQLNVDFTTVLETEVVDGVAVPLLSGSFFSVKTIALLADSPAIDAGDNALAVDMDGNPLTLDQRGATRIVDGAGSYLIVVDIGAFEALAQDFVVDSSGDGSDGDLSTGELTLREAIELANTRSNQNAISFAPQVSGATISLTDGELVITENLTITGPGAAEDLVIDAQGDSRVIRTTAEVNNLTLESLTITNGQTEGDGGGIRFDGSRFSSLTLNNSVVGGNMASGNGGGISASLANVTLNDSTVSGNEITGADGSGGGIYASGDLSILRNFHASVTLNNSTVSGNATTGLNASGGGIAVKRGNITLAGSTVSRNSTVGPKGFGGGIYAAGVFPSFAEVTLDNSTVSGNSTKGRDADGGGIYANRGGISLTNGSTVSGNTTIGSNAKGGGIFSGSGGAAIGSRAVTLIDSTVSGNSTTGENADGGGISTSASSVLLTNSTVSGNSTAGELADGGGIWTLQNGVSLTNSTVSGNATRRDGGGIYTRISATVTLANSTVSGNTADRIGGGISFYHGFSYRQGLVADNSIIAGNSDNGSAPDFEAAGSLGTMNVQNSIVGDTTGTGLTSGNNNQLDVDFTTVLETEVVDGLTVPLLADNGGVVETIALLAGSPAIDAGDNALAVDLGGNPLTSDQRGGGFARFTDGDDEGTATVDIGAFEFGSKFRLGDVNQSGTVDFLDISPFLAILTANAFQDEADIDRNGTVDFLDIAPFIGLLSSPGTNFIVSNAGLSGPGSLPQAIFDANISLGLDTIEILPGVGTIQLTDELIVTDSVTIEGNGNTIAGNTDFSRIFSVSDGAIEFNLDDITLSGGGSFSLDGGAVLASSPTTEISISNSVLTGNRGLTGGAINAAGVVTINRSQIVDNESANVGGGINASGSLILTNSTLSGNLAISGGGIYNHGTAAITNSTLSGNSASFGGGIYNHGTATIANNTLASNSASILGGGIFNHFGTATVTNSIVASNSGGDLYDMESSFGGSHNLIGDGSKLSDFTESISGDPMLGPLADNGGPTMTHALLRGSPAIDSGRNALVDALGGNQKTTDQRGGGFERLMDGDNDGIATVDIGAFEFERTLLLGDVDQNGVVDFLDISPFNSALFSAVFIDEADIDRDGRVGFSDIGPFISELSSSSSEQLEVAQFILASSEPPESSQRVSVVTTTQTVAAPSSSSLEPSDVSRPQLSVTPTEPSLLAFVGRSHVQKLDSSHPTRIELPDLNVESAAMQLLHRKADRLAQGKSSYRSGSRASSLFDASSKPVVATSSTELFDCLAGLSARPSI